MNGVIIIFFSICIFFTTIYLLEISFYLSLSPFLFSLNWTKFISLLSSLPHVKLPWPSTGLVTSPFIATDSLCWLCHLNWSHLSIFFITRNPQLKFFLHWSAMAKFKFARSLFIAIVLQVVPWLCVLLFCLNLFMVMNWKSWVLCWLVFRKDGCFFVFGFGFLGCIWWDVVVYLGLLVVVLGWWCGWGFVVEIGFVDHRVLQRSSCWY